METASPPRAEERSSGISPAATTAPATPEEKAHEAGPRPTSPRRGRALAAEIAWLETAERLLREGADGRALELVAAHRRRFPRSKLRLERERIQRDALAAGYRASH